MNIAYISYEHPAGISGGGIGTYIGQIAKIMTERGHNVDVFIASEKAASSFEYDGYTIHPVEAKTLETFRVNVVEIFTKQYLLKPFDIIESPEYGADALGIRRKFPFIPLAIKLHTPAFITKRLNNYKTSHASKLRFIAGSLVRGKKVEPYWIYDKHEDAEYELFKLADAVYSPSNSLAEIISKEWPSEKVIEVIPNPFSPSTALLNAGITGFKDSPLIVTFLGRLEKRKGILDLMKAIPKVLSYSRKVVFRFVGKSHPSPEKGLNMEEYLKKHLQKYTSNLQFYGVQPYQNIPAILSDTHICVFPSVWENFPNVCLEAMAAGRVVIGTNNGGMADIITHNVSGLHINPSAPQEIAEAIKTLLINPHRIDLLGKAAREKVMLEYNAEKIGSLTESFYKRTIAKCCPAYV